MLSDIAINPLDQDKKNVEITESKISNIMQVTVVFLYTFNGNKIRGDNRNSCMSTLKYQECPVHYKFD